MRKGEVVKLTPKGRERWGPDSGLMLVVKDLGPDTSLCYRSHGIKVSCEDGKERVFDATELTSPWIQVGGPMKRLLRLVCMVFGCKPKKKRKLPWAHPLSRRSISVCPRCGK